MHKKEIQNAITPLEAIEKVKANTNYQYKWFAVKGKNDCIFEIGGRNYNGFLELKAYIPYFTENGEPVFYPLNDMLHSNFCITYGTIAHPNDGMTLSLDDFLKTIKKDVRKFERQTKYKTVTKEVAYTSIRF